MITITGQLSTNVAPAGTLSVTIPAPFDWGRFVDGIGHVLEMNGSTLQSPKDFSVAVGASNVIVTITNKTLSTWAIGQNYILQLNAPGNALSLVYSKNSTTQNPPQLNRAANVDASVSTKRIDPIIGIALIGAPATKSTTAILNVSTAFESAYIGVNAVTTPITVPGGCAGRALQVTSSSASDTSQTITVTGTDFLGNVMSQAFALNGTAVISGTKAFATVTAITCSVAVTVGTISVGTLDVFGLPCVLMNAGYVIKDLTDAAISGTAGTFVVADNTSGGATTTTGDVRGTYAPNTASNGVHYYQVIYLSPDFYYPGTPQV